MLWSILTIVRFVGIVSVIPIGCHGFQPPKSQTIIAGFHPQEIENRTPTEGPYIKPPKCPKCDCNSPPPPREPPNPISIIPGATLGIPLNILTWLYTTYELHDPTVLTPQIVVLNCLIGTYTYGMDRMMDAVAYEKSKGSCEKVSKHALYQYILENYDILKTIYSSIYWIFAMLMMADPLESGIRAQTLVFLVLYELAKFSNNLQYTFFSYYLGIRGYKLYTIYAAIGVLIANTHWFDTEFRYLPFLMAIDTAQWYPALKRSAGYLKAPYVAAMWTTAIAVLPNVLHTHQFTINPSIAIPFLGMIGLSNLADLKDIEEDRENEIYTIPVLFGITPAIMSSFVSMSLAVLLHTYLQIQ